MDCNGVIEEYNYCTTYGFTVYPIEYNIDVATEEWELEIKLKSEAGRVIIWKVEESGEKLKRLDSKTWVVPKREEDLIPGIYTYIVYYKYNDDKVVVSKGKITVNPS